MGKITVEFYSTPNGVEPAKDFLDSLDIKMRAKMLRSIELLRDNGGELREPTSKPLGDGIYELRAQMGIILPEYYISSLSATGQF